MHLKKKIYFVFVLSMCVHFVNNCAMVAANNTLNSGFKFVMQGTNDFSIDLYQVLSKSNPGTSVLVSPLSLQLLLALIYIGSHGKTADEISEALKLPKSDQNSVLEGYRQLINALKAPELTLMTKMFAENQFSIKEDFQNNALAYFQSSVKNVNFSADKDVVNTINEWVERITNGKITDLITTDVLNSNTVMVLVSVVHFKADWHMQFPESETFESDFHVTKDEVNQVPMMAIYDEKFRYFDHPGLKAKILEIPYKNHQFSMYVVLPHAVDGLSQLEQSLDQFDIYQAIQNLYPISVDVILPKFKLSQTFDYKDMLQNIGINAMFSDLEADLSGISNGPLIVSNILQNTFIEVNENGTEAAAGTGTMISLRSFQYKTHFTADHPFMFLITKNSRNSKSKPLPIFIGKFNSK